MAPRPSRTPRRSRRSTAERLVVAGLALLLGASLLAIAPTTAASALVTSFDVTSPAPPAARWGVPYAHTFTSDPPGATWAVVDGDLPTGLTLDGATGALTGTSTTLGTFPVTVEAAWERTFTAVDGGATHSCRLLETGAADCWGDNSWGKADDQAGPFTELRVGFDHTCGLTPAGAIDCWGRNLEGQADDDAGPYTTMATGTGHTCALTTAGAAECRGNDLHGQSADPPGPYTTIATGTVHTCALTPAGAADCWGWNNAGQSTDQPGPFTALALGSTHTCGLTPTGALDCWGSNANGRAPDLPGPFTAVAAGTDHTCALTVAGALECWGVNDDGQVASAPGPFGALGAGEQHTCVLRIERTTTICWGRNDGGQASPPPGPPPTTTQVAVELTVEPPTIGPPSLPTLTYGTSATGGLTASPTGATWAIVDGALPAGLLLDTESGALRGTPLEVGTSAPVTAEATWTSRFTELAGGDAHTCGLLETGGVQCWGGTTYGQSADQVGPYQAITAGYAHTCALTRTGAADCWGANLTGQAVDRPGPYTAIGAGLGHTCALRQSDASADCWGENIHGQANDQTGPFTALATGTTHNCGLTPAGAADCWGWNSHGQAADQAGPFTAVAIGSYHTCAITTAGDLDCWGANGNGQAPPLQPGPFTAVSAGTHHTCALRPSGAVECFGDDSEGQATDQAGPFTTIAAGDQHTCATTPAGAATCWGRDEVGQSTAEVPVLTDQQAFTVNVAAPAITSPAPTSLGWGAPSAHTFTAQVPPGAWTVTDGTLPDGLALDAATGALVGAPTTVGTSGPITVTASWGQAYATVDAGWQHSCALRTSGSVECWGSGSVAADQAGPYTALTSGFSHTCALTPTGAADCWGNGGNSHAADQPGPYTSVSAGVVHTCALTPTGAADCWGSDTHGQATDRPGPYTSISAGVVHTCALTPAGAADCWGSNSNGQAADQTGPYTALALGDEHTCGLTPAGALDCWGSNAYGKAPDLPGPYTAVTAGSQHTCVLTAAGGAECVGDDTSGQAGDRPGPFAAIGAGDAHTCGVALSGGAITCWGEPGGGRTAVAAPVDPPATQTQTFSVDVTPPTITSPAPVGGSWGSPFGHTFTASAPGATWAVTTGALPPGLALHPTTGALTGTPGPASPVGPVTVRATWPTLPDGPTQTFQLMTGPSISPIADQVLAHGTASATVTFTVGDEDGPPSALAVAATSSDQALVADGDLVLAGTGTWRSLTVTPTPGATGTASVTVTATDADGSSVTRAFAVTVEGPSGSITGTITRQADGSPAVGAVVFAFASTDADLPSASATTGVDGTYHLGGLAPETYRVAVVPPSTSGLRSAWFGGTSRATATDVAVATSAVGGIDVALADAPPAVTDMVPKAGLAGGGATVTLRGTGFSGATAVRFGPTAATSFAVVDDRTLTAVAPARPVGLVNVWVETPAGTNPYASVTHFSYQNAPTGAPVVTSVTPNIGDVAGGQTVTILGSGFLSASSVVLGQAPAAGYTIVNDAKIIATTPPRATPALVNVWVTNPNGTNPNQSSSWYDYRIITGPPPTVTSLSSGAGPTAGGQTLTITGTGFTGTIRVDLGGTTAPAFTVVDDTTITVTTPARPAGLVNVWVRTNNGANTNQPQSWYRYQ